MAQANHARRPTINMPHPIHRCKNQRECSNVPAAAPFPTAASMENTDIQCADHDRMADRASAAAVSGCTPKFSCQTIRQALNGIIGDDIALLFIRLCQPRRTRGFIGHIAVLTFSAARWYCGCRRCFGIGASPDGWVVLAVAD